MTARNILCVDLSNQAYKACHAFAGLTSEGRFTGGLYGFLVLIQKAARVINATDIVICQDTKPYLRSQMYPAYKSLRKEAQDPDLAEAVRYSITLVRELLDIIGWPLWSVQGFESDDLIAHVMRKYRHRYDLVVAMSNDSDLFQMFEFPNFAVYRGKKGLYTRDDYIEEWQGMGTEQFLVAHALMGTHNEVEGIKGIGPVTARDMVSHPFKLRAAREKHAAIIDRNMQLIKLPHDKLPYRTQIPPYTRSYHERDLLRFCGRYDITLTQEMCSAFSKLGPK